MVYIGRPSRACAHCRRRKLRCDLRKEACGQCVRASLVCSGYRDPDQLRIQDESQSTKQRALFRRATKPTLNHHQTLQVSLHDMARAAFFSHYVCGFAKTYDVLERIGRQTTLEPHLAASVDAVSLAFFEFQTHHPDVLGMSRRARESYLTALPLVNQALLGGPETLSSDSTLLAVLFLDLFEKMMNNNPRSSTTWMSHVNGAMALFKFRQTQQLGTYVGRRLSTRLFTNLLISCCAADMPLPLDLIHLQSDLEPYVDGNDPKWKVSCLVVKYLILRGAMDQQQQHDTLEKAQELDGEFRSLADSMPPSWVATRVPLQTPSDRVLEQYFDVYPDHFTAQTCNVIRIMRIMLNDTIRSIYAQMALQDDETKFFNSQSAAFASQVIDTMARQICATGPQFTTAVEDAAPRRKIGEFTPLHKLHCYTLLFPFYVAGMYASPESNIQPWIAGQLRQMSRDSGIKNAVRVAEMLESKDGTPPWSVYAILGSYAFAA